MQNDLANVVLTVAGKVPAELDGRLFQVYLLPDGRVQLSPVMLCVDERCPVILKGERCGGTAGHEGRHYWAGGD